ncbi:MAG: hypothetical protein C4297_07880 [Gemmataceae bacterium]
MYRWAVFLPTLVWLLWPAGVCLCHAQLLVPVSAPTSGPGQSEDHAPGCPYLKAFAPYARLEPDSKPCPSDCQTWAFLPPVLPAVESSRLARVPCAFPICDYRPALPAYLLLKHFLN